MARSAESAMREKIRKAAWNAARRKTPAPPPPAPTKSGGGSKSG